MAKLKNNAALYPDRILAGDTLPKRARLFKRKFSRKVYKKQFIELSQQDQTHWLEKYKELKRSFRKSGQTSETLPSLFALVHCAMVSTLQTELNSSVCLLAFHLLNRTAVESSKPYEKDQALLLAAFAATLTDEPIHIFCVNSDSANRFKNFASQVLSALGVQVEVVVETDDSKMRKRKYLADIVVVLSKEIALDFLRDELSWPQRKGGLSHAVDTLYGSMSRTQHMHLRGMYWGFFERLDQALIDESRTPIVIGTAAAHDHDQDLLDRVYTFCDGLKDNQDYQIDINTGVLRVFNPSVQLVRNALIDNDGISLDSERVRLYVTNALRVQRQLVNEQHYQRSGDRLVIPGLIPGQGYLTGEDLNLVKLFLSCREPGAAVGSNDVIARTSYISLYKRYFELSGLVTSAYGLAGELNELYGIRCDTNSNNGIIRALRCKVVVHESREDIVNSIFAMVGNAKAVAGHSIFVATTDFERNWLKKMLDDRDIEAVCENTSHGTSLAEIKAGITLTTMKDFLPRCTNKDVFSDAYRVDVFLLGLPASIRHVMECLFALRQGKVLGSLRYMLVCTADFQGDTMIVPGVVYRFKTLLDSFIFQPLLRVLIYRHIRNMERQEARARAALFSQQENIDNLFSFSGRKN